MPVTVSGNATAGSAASAPAAPPQAKISAQAGVRIDFSRAAVVAQTDPDGKLRQLLSGQPAGAITRSASAGSLGAPLAEMTVTFAGWSQYGGGKRVVVNHADDLKTSYNHTWHRSI